MQELDLYHALLEELTDAQLVEVIGREARRRKAISIMLLSKDEKTYSAVCWPVEWGSLAEEPLVEQLKCVAAWVAMGEETRRRTVEDDATNSAS